MNEEGVQTFPELRLDKTTFSATATAIEITFFNMTLLELDGVSCSVTNLTVPLPISLCSVVLLTSREVDCFYASIPLFSSYRELLKTTRTINVQFNATELLLNDYLIEYVSNRGCESVQPTEVAPTAEPDRRRCVVSVEPQTRAL